MLLPQLERDIWDDTQERHEREADDAHHESVDALVGSHAHDNKQGEAAPASGIENISSMYHSLKRRFVLKSNKRQNQRHS